MPSVNKVILLGNLGADPELKYTSSGKAVVTLRVATTVGFGGPSRDGKEPPTEWHQVVVWDKLAEQCSQFLSKGRQVYIEGRLQTRSWDDKQGQKRYTTEIVAKEVLFLGGGSGRGAGREQGDMPPHPAHQGGQRGYGYAAEPPAQGDMDDIPPSPFPSDDQIPF